MGNQWFNFGQLQRHAKVHSCHSFQGARVVNALGCCWYG